MSGDSVLMGRDMTAVLREMIAADPNQCVVVDGRGGWKIALYFNALGEIELRHFQPSPDAKYKFFMYTTEGNPYGAGKIVQEPTLAVPVLEKKLPLIGALVLDGTGEVVERFSWSNLHFIQHRRFEVTDSNRLWVSDSETGQMVPKGYLRALFLPDKNRLTGYVGVFMPTHTRKVRILEMEELLLKSIL